MILSYIWFCLITLVFVCFLVRIFVFAIIFKVDPLKSVTPNISQIIAQFHRKKKVVQSIAENS